MHTNSEIENSGKGNHKHRSTRKESDATIEGINEEVRDFCKSASAMEGSLEATVSGYWELRQRKGRT